MRKLIALGEILIDFTPLTHPSKPTFQQNAGGAPVNVLSCASKFGVPTSFIGCIGDDIFGQFLTNFLHHHQIDCSYLKVSKDRHTTLAFIHLRDDGDRNFSFYRNHGADKMLEDKDIRPEMFSKGDIFHFGSLSMTDEPSRSATLKAIQLAKEQGCLISYDPNLRPALWQNLEEAKKMMLLVLSQVDILKVSEEELYFLTDATAIESAVRKLHTAYPVPLILITLGDKGSAFFFKNQLQFTPAFPVHAIDTTGAGDSYLGSILYQLLKYGGNLNQLSISEIENFVHFANKTAAIVTTRYGSAEIMPSYEEVFSEDL